MTSTPASIDRENLFFLLTRLTRRWRQVLDAEIGALTGLTDAGWRPLLHLMHLGDGVRQKDLALSLGIEGPSLVRLLDNLVDKGLVERLEHSSDRRAKELRLTPAGQQLVARIQEVLVPLETELLGTFSDAEISTLARFVDQVGANVSQIKDRRKSR